MRTHLLRQLTGVRAPPEKQPAARVNGVPYDTLEEAIEAARGTIGPKTIEVSRRSDVTFPPGTWDLTGLRFQVMG